MGNMGERMSGVVSQQVNECPPLQNSRVYECPGEQMPGIPAIALLPYLNC